VTEKFRVGVVTVWEVEAVDRSDAIRKAEGAVMHAVRLASVAPSGADPHVRWRWYGNLHEASLVSAPLEVDTAFAGGLIRVSVSEED
jgi:dihydroorotase-like cyclic amidohydrolase